MSTTAEDVRSMPLSGGSTIGIDPGDIEKIRNFTMGRKGSGGSATYSQILALRAEDIAKFKNSLLTSAALATMYVLGAGGSILPVSAAYRIDKSPSAAIVTTGNIKNEDWATFIPVEPDLTNDQPRFSYGEVMAYAERMGLPTEFPL